MAVSAQSRHALLVLGMQRECVDRDGFFQRQAHWSLSDPDRAALLANINRLAAHFRRMNMPVIRTFWSFRPDYVDCCFSRAWQRRGLGENRVLVEGTAGTAFPDELVMGPDDFSVQLRSFSAFQFTETDRILRNCKVENVVLVGGSAEGAIDDSARQGAADGYRMLLPLDGVYPLGNRSAAELTNRLEPTSSANLIEILGHEGLPFPLPKTAAEATRRHRA